MKHWFRKSISILVVFTMLSETCFAQVPGLSFDFATEKTPKLIAINIPAELASVEEFWEAPARPNPKMILHIQNAHTNYEAQQKIRDLMSYLNKNYGFKTIFVEGASENLNPDYLKLFPDAETNKKLWDELAKRGQITGADWFLLTNSTYAVKDLKPRRLGRGVGIEKAELYKKNYEALKAVFSREAETTKFLTGLDSELDKLASTILPPETRKIISEWKKFEKGHREFIPFVSTLSKLAKENLKLDLKGIYSQIEWPQLTRLLALQDMEYKLKQPADQRLTTNDQRSDERSALSVQQSAELEKQAMIEFLKSKNVSKELIFGLEKFDEKNINMNQIRASSGKMESLPRFFIEKLIEEAGPKGLRFSEYPNFALYAGYIILKYEIEPNSLFSEIKKLFEQLLDSTNDQRLPTTDKSEPVIASPSDEIGINSAKQSVIPAKAGIQSELINLFRDAELERKLLNLELSREEWQQTILKKESLQLNQLFERVKSLSGQSLKVKGQNHNPKPANQTEETYAVKDLEPRRLAVVPSEYQKQILTAFESAFSFYDFATQRETVFAQKIASELEHTDRAILMTGGFHTDGLKQIFREKEISYGTLTPRLTKVESSNLYREVMLGKEVQRTAYNVQRAPLSTTGERDGVRGIRGTNDESRHSKDATVETISRSKSANGKLADASFGVVEHDKRRADTLGSAEVEKLLKANLNQSGNGRFHPNQDNAALLKGTKKKNAGKVHIHANQNSLFSTSQFKNFDIFSFGHTQITNMNGVMPQTHEPFADSGRDGHVEQKLHALNLSGREGLFASEKSTELNRRENIGLSQVRVISQDLSVGLTRSEQIQNQMNGNSQAPDAGLSGKNRRINTDAVKVFHIDAKSSMASAVRQTGGEIATNDQRLTTNDSTDAVKDLEPRRLGRETVEIITRAELIDAQINQGAIMDQVLGGMKNALLGIEGMTREKAEEAVRKYAANIRSEHRLTLEKKSMRKEAYSQTDQYFGHLLAAAGIEAGEASRIKANTRVWIRASSLVSNAAVRRGRKKGTINVNVGEKEDISFAEVFAHEAGHGILKEIVPGAGSEFHEAMAFAFQLMANKANGVEFPSYYRDAFVAGKILQFYLRTSFGRKAKEKLLGLDGEALEIKRMDLLGFGQEDFLAGEPKGDFVRAGQSKAKGDESAISRRKEDFFQGFVEYVFTEFDTSDKQLFEYVKNLFNKLYGIEADLFYSHLMGLVILDEVANKMFAKKDFSELTFEESVLLVRELIQIGKNLNKEVEMNPDGSMSENPMSGVLNPDLFIDVGKSNDLAGDALGSLGDLKQSLSYKNMVSTQAALEFASPTQRRDVTRDEKEAARRGIYRTILLNFFNTGKSNSLPASDLKSHSGAGRAEMRKPKEIRRSSNAHSYSDAALNFQGVDAEHFVAAQMQLSETGLNADPVKKAAVLELLELSADASEENIFNALAQRGYSSDAVNRINGDTYSDPWLDVSITHQNKNARVQSIYEAVANSLDALGYKIGQFGKGIKQALDWLRQPGDRIEVVTREKPGSAMLLTILRGPNGQLYIELKPVSDAFFEERAGAIEHGTVLDILPTQPLHVDPQTKNDQEALREIEKGVRKRFPFITHAVIETQLNGDPARKVNGFGHKRQIVPKQVGEMLDAEAGHKKIAVQFLEDRIRIADNGKGMNARTLARMFVPKKGDKAPESQNIALIWDEASEFPNRIAFARNGEVIQSVELPADILPASMLSGLMVDFGHAMEVTEARDQMLIKNEGHEFEASARELFDGILAADLTDEQKIIMINSILIGLDALTQDKTLLEGVLVEAIKKTADLMKNLRANEFLMLPYFRDFAKVQTPDNKKILHLHPGLLGHDPAAYLAPFGAKMIPGIRFGKNKLPLYVLPFTAEAQEAWLREIHPEFADENVLEQMPVAVLEDVILLGDTPTTWRYLALQNKKFAGEKLDQDESQFFEAQTEIFAIQMGRAVNVGYAIGFDASAERQKMSVEQGRSDVKLSNDNHVGVPYENTFLVRAPDLDDAADVDQEGISPQALLLPPDTAMPYALLNKKMVDVATGQTVTDETDKEVLIVRRLINDYYMVLIRNDEEAYYELFKFEEGKWIRLTTKGEWPASNKFGLLSGERVYLSGEADEDSSLRYLSVGDRDPFDIIDLVTEERITSSTHDIGETEFLYYVEASGGVIFSIARSRISKLSPSWSYTLWRSNPAKMKEDGAAHVSIAHFDDDPLSVETLGNHLIFVTGENYNTVVDTRTNGFVELAKESDVSQLEAIDDDIMLARNLDGEIVIIQKSTGMIKKSSDFGMSAPQQVARIYRQNGESFLSIRENDESLDVAMIDLKTLENVNNLEEIADLDQETVVIHELGKSVAILKAGDSDSTETNATKFNARLSYYSEPVEDDANERFTNPFNNEFIIAPEGSTVVSWKGTEVLLLSEDGKSAYWRFSGNPALATELTVVSTHTDSSGARKILFPSITNQFISMTIQPDGTSEEMGLAELQKKSSNLEYVSHDDRYYLFRDTENNDFYYVNQDNPDKVTHVERGEKHVSTWSEKIDLPYVALREESGKMSLINTAVGDNSITVEDQIISSADGRHWTMISHNDGWFSKTIEDYWLEADGEMRTAAYNLDALPRLNGEPLNLISQSPAFILLEGKNEEGRSVRFVLNRHDKSARIFEHEHEIGAGQTTGSPSYFVARRNPDASELVIYKGSEENGHVLNVPDLMLYWLSDRADIIFISHSDGNMSLYDLNAQNYVTQNVKHLRLDSSGRFVIAYRESEAIDVFSLGQEDFKIVNGGWVKFGYADNFIRVDSASGEAAFFDLTGKQIEEPDASMKDAALLKIESYDVEADKKSVTFVSGTSVIQSDPHLGYHESRYVGDFLVHENLAECAKDPSLEKVLKVVPLDDHSKTVETPNYSDFELLPNGAMLVRADDGQYLIQKNGDVKELPRRVVLNQTKTFFYIGEVPAGAVTFPSGLSVDASFQFATPDLRKRFIFNSLVSTDGEEGLSTLGPEKVPEGFEFWRVSGKNFIFYNSASRKFLSLNPEAGIKHVLAAEDISNNFGQVDLRVQKWHDRVQSHRDALIAQFRATYDSVMGSLLHSENISESIRVHVEQNILPHYLRTLFSMQEAAVNKWFIQNEENPDAVLDETELPFTKFDSALRILQQAIGEGLNANNRMLLHMLTMSEQEAFFRNYFRTVLNFATDESWGLELPRAFAQSENLFLAGMGWQPQMYHQPGDVELIKSFIGSLGSVSFQNKIKIVRMFSALSGRGAEKHLVLMEQIKRMSHPQYGEYRQDFVQQIEQAPIENIERVAMSTSKLSEALITWVVFFSDRVEQVEEREMKVLSGQELISQRVPLEGVEQLELRRDKPEGAPKIMSLDYLVAHADEAARLGAEAQRTGQALTQNISNQREALAHTMEFTQNSQDGKARKVTVEFFTQKNPVNSREEFVEKVSDDGTGALNEVALLIEKSPKAESDQEGVSGFFGKGKFTYFDGMDRVEIITKKEGSNGTVFLFETIRNERGKVIGAHLTGIRALNPGEVAANGLTLLRIKYKENCIPEIDQMRAKQAWRNFNGIAAIQDPNFTIVFKDKNGEHPFFTDKDKPDALTELDFITMPARPPEDEEDEVEPAPKNFGAIRMWRIIREKNGSKMPMQIVDGGGRRVRSLGANDPIFDLVPAALRKYISDMGLVIQIPLKLTGPRNSFVDENHYMPAIQRYVAALYYRALALRTIESNMSFTFLGFPQEFDTGSENIERMEKFFDAQEGSFNYQALQVLRGLNKGVLVPEAAEVFSRFVGASGEHTNVLQHFWTPLIASLEIDRQNEKQSLLGMMLAVQPERAARLLVASGAKPAGSKQAKNLAERQNMAKTLAGVKNPNRATDEVKDLNQQGKFLLKFAQRLAVQLGFDPDVVWFAKPESMEGISGLFSRTQITFKQSLTTASIQRAVNVIIHEFAHLLEFYAEQNRSELSEGEVFIAADDRFTHQPEGVFADMMKRVAAIASHIDFWLEVGPAGSRTTDQRSTPNAQRGEQRLALSGRPAGSRAEIRLTEFLGEVQDAKNLASRFVNLIKQASGSLDSWTHFAVADGFDMQAGTAEIGRRGAEKFSHAIDGQLSKGQSEDLWMQLYSSLKDNTSRKRFLVFAAESPDSASERRLIIVPVAQDQKVLINQQLLEKKIRNLALVLRKVRLDRFAPGLNFYRIEGSYKRSFYLVEMEKNAREFFAYLKMYRENYEVGSFSEEEKDVQQTQAYLLKQQKSFDWWGALNHYFISAQLAWFGLLALILKFFHRDGIIDHVTNDHPALLIPVLLCAPIIFGIYRFIVFRIEMNHFRWQRDFVEDENNYAPPQAQLDFQPANKIVRNIILFGSLIGAHFTVEIFSNEIKSWFPASWFPDSDPWVMVNQFSPELSFMTVTFLVAAALFLFFQKIDSGFKALMKKSLFWMGVGLISLGADQLIHPFDKTGLYVIGGRLMGVGDFSFLFGMLLAIAGILRIYHGVIFEPTDSYRPIGRGKRSLKAKIFLRAESRIFNNQQPPTGQREGLPVVSRQPSVGHGAPFIFFVKPSKSDPVKGESITLGFAEADKPMTVEISADNNAFKDRGLLNFLELEGDYPNGIMLQWSSLTEEAQTIYVWKIDKKEDRTWDRLKATEIKNIAVGSPDLRQRPYRVVFMRDESRPGRDQKEVWRAAFEREVASPIINPEHEVSPSAQALVSDGSLSQGASILDLGAWMGHDTLYFAGNGFEVTAADVIEEPLVRISQIAATKGFETKIKTKVLDLQNPVALPAESFDVIFANLSMHYLDDQILLARLLELQNALKPGGRIVMVGRSTQDPKFTGAQNRDGVFTIDQNGKRQRYFETQSLRDLLGVSFPQISFREIPAHERYLGQGLTHSLEVVINKVASESRTEKVARNESRVSRLKGLVVASLESMVGSLLSLVSSLRSPASGLWSSVVSRQSFVGMELLGSAALLGASLISAASFPVLAIPVFAGVMTLLFWSINNQYRNLNGPNGFGLPALSAGRKAFRRDEMRLAVRVPHDEDRPASRLRMVLALSMVGLGALWAAKKAERQIPDQTIAQTNALIQESSTISFEGLLKTAAERKQALGKVPEKDRIERASQILRSLIESNFGEYSTEDKKALHDLALVTLWIESKLELLAQEKVVRGSDKKKHLVPWGPAFGISQNESRFVSGSDTLIDGVINYLRAPLESDRDLAVAVARVLGYQDANALKDMWSLLRDKHKMNEIQASRVLRKVMTKRIVANDRFAVLMELVKYRRAQIVQRVKFSNIRTIAELAVAHKKLYGAGVTGEEKVKEALKHVGSLTFNFNGDDKPRAWRVIPNTFVTLDGPSAAASDIAAIAPENLVAVEPTTVTGNTDQETAAIVAPQTVTEPALPDNVAVQSVTELSPDTGVTVKPVEPGFFDLVKKYALSSVLLIPGLGFLLGQIGVERASKRSTRLLWRSKQLWSMIWFNSLFIFGYGSVIFYKLLVQKVLIARQAWETLGALSGVGLVTMQITALLLLSEMKPQGVAAKIRRVLENTLEFMARGIRGLVIFSKRVLFRMVGLALMRKRMGADVRSLLREMPSPVGLKKWTALFGGATVFFYASRIPDMNHFLMDMQQARENPVPGLMESVARVTRAPPNKILQANPLLPPLGWEKQSPPAAEVKTPVEKIPTPAIKKVSAPISKPKPQTQSKPPAKSKQAPAKSKSRAESRTAEEWGDLIQQATAESRGGERGDVLKLGVEQLTPLMAREVLDLLRGRKLFQAGRALLAILLDSMIVRLQDGNIKIDKLEEIDGYRIIGRTNVQYFKQEQGWRGFEIYLQKAIAESVFKLCELPPLSEEKVAQIAGKNYSEKVTSALNFALQAAGEKGLLVDISLLPVRLRLSSTTYIDFIHTDSVGMDLMNTNGLGAIKIVALYVKEGVPQEKEEMLGVDETTVGRADTNTIVIPDDIVSGKHFVIRHDASHGNKIRIIQLGRNKASFLPLIRLRSGAGSQIAISTRVLRENELADNQRAWQIEALVKAVEDGVSNSTRYGEAQNLLAAIRGQDQTEKAISSTIFVDLAWLEEAGFDAETQSRVIANIRLLNLRVSTTGRNEMRESELKELTGIQSDATATLVLEKIAAVGGITDADIQGAAPRTNNFRQAISKLPAELVKITVEQGNYNLKDWIQTTADNGGESERAQIDRHEKEKDWEALFDLYAVIYLERQLSKNTNIALREEKYERVAAPQPVSAVDKKFEVEAEQFAGGVRFLNDKEDGRDQKSLTAKELLVEVLRKGADLETVRAIVDQTNILIQALERGESIDTPLLFGKLLLGQFRISYSAPLSLGLPAEFERQQKDRVMKTLAERLHEFDQDGKKRTTQVPYRELFLEINGWKSYELAQRANDDRDPLRNLMVNEIAEASFRNQLAKLSRVEFREMRPQSRVPSIESRAEMRHSDGAAAEGKAGFYEMKKTYQARFETSVEFKEVGSFFPQKMSIYSFEVKERETRRKFYYFIPEIGASMISIRNSKDLRPDYMKPETLEMNGMDLLEYSFVELNLDQAANEWRIMGIKVEEDYQGRGYVSKMLKQVFNLMPEVKSVGAAVRNLPLLLVLYRDFNFMPKDGNATDYHWAGAGAADYLETGIPRFSVAEADRRAFFDYGDGTANLWDVQIVDAVPEGYAPIPFGGILRKYEETVTEEPAAEIIQLKKPELSPRATQIVENLEEIKAWLRDQTADWVDGLNYGLVNLPNSLEMLMDTAEPHNIQFLSKVGALETLEDANPYFDKAESKLETSFSMLKVMLSEKGAQLVKSAVFEQQVWAMIERALQLGQKEEVAQLLAYAREQSEADKTTPVISDENKKFREAFKGKKVMIVDDMLPILTVTRDGFLAAGAAADVQVFSSAAEAMEALLKGDFVPDLIITDHEMPNMSGGEFLRELQKDKFKITHAIPKIIFSGGNFEAGTSRELDMNKEAEVLGVEFSPKDTVKLFQTATRLLEKSANRGEMRFLGFNLQELSRAESRSASKEILAALVAGCTLLLSPLLSRAEAAEQVNEIVFAIQPEKDQRMDWLRQNGYASDAEGAVVELRNTLPESRERFQSEKMLHPNMHYYFVIDAVAEQQIILENQAKAWREIPNVSVTVSSTKNLNKDLKSAIDAANRKVKQSADFTQQVLVVMNDSYAQQTNLNQLTETSPIVVVTYNPFELTERTYDTRVLLSLRAAGKLIENSEELKTDPALVYAPQDSVIMFSFNSPYIITLSEAYWTELRADQAVSTAA